MKNKHPNENADIVILPGEAKKAPTAAERNKIRRLVRDKLLVTSKEPYHKVQVEVEKAPDGSPKALIASMLRANTYTADIVRMNVDRDYNPTSVEPCSGTGAG